MPADTLPQHLIGQLDVLMIDNFDSFTWNLYQQLSLQGAEVTVIRNDAISPALLPQLQIKFLIISPGPGHPQTDSGISKAAIEYFQGKLPVLGVCMGLECLVDLHGGEIGCVLLSDGVIPFWRLGLVSKAGDAWRSTSLQASLSRFIF